MRNVFSGQQTASVPRGRLGSGNPLRRRSRCRRILTLVRCLGLTMFAVHAYADDALRHFDIQTQGAASALNEFARQADITLVFASSMVAKHQTVTIRGDFTVIEALRKLLDGSGLSFKQVGAATIAISAAGDSQDPPNKTQIKGDSNMNHQGLLARIAALFAFSGAVLAGC